METPFEYPTDRSSLFEPADEEEAHFYHTLNDFKDLIDRYGEALVLNRLDGDSFRRVAAWILNEDEAAVWTQYEDDV